MNLNLPVSMSSSRSSDILHVYIDTHELVFDTTHSVNKKFADHVKRGNGFTKDQIKEPATTRAIYNLNRQFDIKSVYDIGCQNLYTTLQLQKIFDCKVTGFDIDKDAIEAGMLNLSLNPTDNITVIDKGVGLESDDCIPLNTLDSVDLIFIDIEGYQKHVIEDGIDFIQKHKPIFIYETDNTNAISYIQPDNITLKPLAKLGYKFFFNKDHRNTETTFNEIEVNDIPVQDGLLVIIPEDKL